MIKKNFVKMRLATDGKNSFVVFSEKEGFKMPANHGTAFRTSQIGVITKFLEQLNVVIKNGESVTYNLVKVEGYVETMDVFQVIYIKKFD